jgi:hypothetical protein
LATQAAIAAKSSSTPTSVVGRDLRKAIVVRDTEAQTTQAKPWADLTGASTTVKVPQGTTAIVIARFTAEDHCEVAAPDICTVRILVGGTEAEPASGTDFAFDTDPACCGYTQAGAMDRSLGPLGPGTYPVQVQWGAGGINTGTFTLDDWSLTVEVVTA